MKILLGTVLLVGLANGAVAAEVVRWVDENGVTHFSERYLAEAPATEVKVSKTNGMDVPDTSALPSRSNGATFRKISKAGKKNKDGWTGYQRRNRNNNRPYYQR